MDILTFLQDALANSEFAKGGLTLGLIGGLTVMLRSLPHRIYSWLMRRFTVEMVIRQGQPVEYISEWLGTKNPRTRHIMGVLKWKTFDNGNSAPQIITVPGLGYHLFRHEKKWFWIVRSLEDAGAQQKPEVLTIRTWGRSHSSLFSLLDTVNEGVRKIHEMGSVVYVLDSMANWNRLNRVVPRTLSSVVLPDGANTILDEVQWFFANASWYGERGVPYRRGYLLHGPPGNGKSVFVQALATEYKLPVYVLMLKGFGMNDSTLARAMSDVPARSVVLLEDADSLLQNRKDEKSKEKTLGDDITLSGILNAIDGILASEGRILFVTTNRPEDIDEAIMRSGRLDRHVYFHKPGPRMVRELYGRFFDEGIEAFEESLNGDESMADIQERLVTMALQGADMSVGEYEPKEVQRPTRPNVRHISDDGRSSPRATIR